MTRQEDEQASDFIKAANNDLYKLSGVEEGREAAKRFMYKYLPESEYAKSFQDYPEMQKLYEQKYLFPVKDHKALMVAEAYQFLNAEISPVKKDIKRNAINGHIISDEALQQTNVELREGSQWTA